MHHWLIIDLEATTDEGGWPVEAMEIIEIGAIIADTAGHELDHFQQFVRPQQRPQLTRFCRSLTHISQQDVDAAQSLPAVQATFDHWLQPHLNTLQGWLSWGNYDRQQLEIEWQRQQLDSPLARLRHHNLKKLVNRQLREPGNRRQIGLNHALALTGQGFSGSQHRALDDARNIARLLPLVAAALHHSGR